MKFTKSIICLAVFAAFGSAYAGSKYLNGSSGITKTEWNGDNIVAGVYWNGETIGGTSNYVGTDNQPATSFDPQATIDISLSDLKIQGGDFIAGNSVSPVGNDKKADMSLSSTKVTLTNLYVDENFILGTKINAYGTADITANIGTASATLINSQVLKATVVGSLFKCSGKVGSSTITNAELNVKDGSKLNGLIIGGVSVYNSGDSTQGSQTTNIVENAVVTIENSTVKKLSDSTDALSGINLTFGDAAIFVGGASGNVSTLDVSTQSTVNNVTLTLKGTTVEGDIYLGGYAHDDDSTATVKSSQLVLGEGTSVSGTIHTGGMNFDGNGSSEVENGTIVVDSADVEIGGFDNQTAAAKSFSLIGSSNFNDDYASAEAALEGIQTMFSTKAATIQEGESNGAISSDAAGNVTKSLNTKTLTIGQTARQAYLNWAMLRNDLNKRMGELRDAPGKYGVWARADAGKQKYEGIEADMRTFQFGADSKIEALGNAYVGAAFSYSDTDFDYATGDGDSKIYSLGVYGSWFSETGSFVDVIGKVSRIENETNVSGTQADYNNTAFSVSAEVGHRFELPANTFVEPQVEMAYGYLNDKSFDTVSSSGQRVASYLDSSETLTGRIGVRAGYNLPEKRGTVYAYASAMHEFLGEMTFTRGSEKFEDDFGDTWIEYGVGASVFVTPSTYLYGYVQRNSGADVEEPWRVNIGLRYAF